MSATRLRQLRLARGLSLDALAAAMGGIVTKQSLSKYEQGKTRPTPAVLTKLATALSVKAVHLWAEPTVRVQFIAYRKSSTLPKREQEMVESLVSDALETRVSLQELTHQANGSRLPIQSIHVCAVENAEQAAETLREEWKLGLAPISSVVNVLEDHMVHVLAIRAGNKFDGISAVARDEGGAVKAAAVVARLGLPGGRQRLNLAHELGHLVLNVPEDVDEEKAAFRFGAAFLAPAALVRRILGERRQSIQFTELLLAKQELGMSIQALLYRLRDLNVITESFYRNAFMYLGKRGWRKQEPMELAQEVPQWLRRTVLRAFAEGVIAKDSAEAMLGEVIEGSPALSLIGRRAFMKLPMEERRRILAEQAAKLEADYKPDPARAAWQGGDFLE